MLQIRYISRSVEPMSAEKLLALLQECLANNVRKGVTGMLLYGNGSFLQALEGEDDVVDDLVRKIEKDPRHEKFHVLQRKTIDKRQFSEWSMGFRQISDRELKTIKGLKNFAESDFTAEYLARHDDVVDALIDHYREPHWDPLVRELDAQDKALETMKQKLSGARFRMEMASLMIESVVDAGRAGALGDEHVALCQSALDTLRQT